MPNLLKFAGAAARLDVSESTLARRMRDGTGPKPTRVGKFVRFTDEAIEEYLIRCGQG